MTSSWDHPLPFIENIDDKLIVNEETASLLDSIEKPMVIVCIAGLYRTGKSYLMNRLAEKKSGFALGSTVESHTKGIWVWNVNHPHDPKKNILIMDTEGLGDAKKGDNTYDMWIFCLSVLLSSVFVYNIMGKIDGQVLDELIFVTEMSKHIQSKASGNCIIEFDEFFPHFILAIRDFFLEPKIDNKEVTSDEYMEVMMLSMKPSTKKVDIERNKIKQKVRSYFKNRKCFFFARPVCKDDDLLHLENVPEENLQEKFIQRSKEFCDHIYATAPVKKIDSTQDVSGRLFNHLARIYIKAINDGAVPCIETAIIEIASRENNKAVHESHEYYITSMKELLTFPVTNEQLICVHENCYEIAVKHFLKKMLLDKGEEYNKKLQECLNKEFEEFQKENISVSIDTCQLFLQALFVDVAENILSGKYMVSDGYLQFEEDICTVIIQYNSIPDKGVMADVILQQFLEERQGIKETILNADKKLTKQEKKFETEKNRKEMLEREANIQAENIKAHKEQEECMRRTYEEQVKSLKETFEKHLQVQEENFKKLIKEREVEVERLCKEQFSKEAEDLKQQIEESKQQKTSTVKRILGSLANIGGYGLTLVPHPGAKVAGLGLSFLGQFFGR